MPEFERIDRSPLSVRSIPSEASIGIDVTIGTGFPLLRRRNDYGPMARLAAMTSSVIRHIIYEPSVKRLLVSFASGHVYAYEGIPGEIAAGLADATSQGAYFNSVIRNKYHWLRRRDLRGE